MRPRRCKHHRTGGVCNAVCCACGTRRPTWGLMATVMPSIGCGCPPPPSAAVTSLAAGVAAASLGEPAGVAPRDEAGVNTGAFGFSGDVGPACSKWMHITTPLPSSNIWRRLTVSATWASWGKHAMVCLVRRGACLALCSVSQLLRQLRAVGLGDQDVEGGAAAPAGQRQRRRRRERPLRLPTLRRQPQ